MSTIVIKLIISINSNVRREAFHKTPLGTRLGFRQYTEQVRVRIGILAGHYNKLGLS